MAVFEITSPSGEVFALLELLLAKLLEFAAWLVLLTQF